MNLIKPSQFLSKSLIKIGLLFQIDQALHGELPAFILGFEARYGARKHYSKFQISRGANPDTCPYRLDYEDNRFMFNSHTKSPWDQLVQHLWGIDFQDIRPINIGIPGEKEESVKIVKEKQAFIQEIPKGVIFHDTEK